ncbi:MAG: tryptophan synthase subunit alpha, partial [Schwartzia sp.]|nr:tryptophan synthase subunit alpha [Schwartzia sp. (in: firmicutes)]
MTRIEKKFAALKDEKKKGLVIYLMAGVPDAKGTIEAVKMAERAGADFIEIGLPFSDPLADGPVIQAAGIRALKGGMTLAGVLDLVKEIRTFTEIPLIGMGYINNVLQLEAVACKDWLTNKVDR